MNASIRCWCQYPPRMNNQHHGSQKERIFGGSNLHSKYLCLHLKIKGHHYDTKAQNYVVQVPLNMVLYVSCFSQAAQLAHFL